MSEPKPIFHFIPASVRARHNGWSAEKQIAFIEALAETGIVEGACRRVGMSHTSADNLRHRPDGMHFRRALGSRPRLFAAPGRGGGLPPLAAGQHCAFIEALVATIHSGPCRTATPMPWVSFYRDVA